MKNLTIVGSGRVGRTLGKLFHDAGTLRVDEVVASTSASAADAVAFIGAGLPGTRPSLTESANRILLLTVPDDAINTVAADIAPAHDDLTGLLAFHCSGSLPAAALQPLADQGATIASIHPIKTFSDPATAVPTFAGTYCAIEPDCDELHQLFADLGAHTFTIESDDKPLYHAGIVLLCNYLYTLTHLGLTTLEQAGLSADHARTAVAPILTETVRNALDLGPARALTGPIKRGDIATIEKHMAALEDHPHLREAYALLGRETLSLTDLDAAVVESLVKALRV